MRMPAPYWPMTYSASRRAHHHRCACCNRIIKDGDSVLMARVAKGTKCIHEECATCPYGTDGFNYRDGLEAWGMAYLSASGWPEAKQFVATDPIFRPGGKAADRLAPSSN